MKNDIMWICFFIIVICTIANFLSYLFIDVKIRFRDMKSRYLRDKLEEERREINELRKQYGMPPIGEEEKDENQI